MDWPRESLADEEGPPADKWQLLELRACSAGVGSISGLYLNSGGLDLCVSPASEADLHNGHYWQMMGDEAMHTLESVACRTNVKVVQPLQGISTTNGGALELIAGFSSFE